MSKSLSVLLLAGVLLFALGRHAMAHPVHGGHDLMDGWKHPFSGADHLLAMVAVGLLAVRMGGKSLWILPATFMAGMVAGGLLPACGVRLPGVEYGILSSVLVFGLLVALANMALLKWGTLIVAVFAVFHGYAHAAEMSAESSLLPYAAGFLLATAVLHLGGILAGVVLARGLRVPAIRVAGGAIAAAGLLLMLEYSL